ncbi:glyoxalase/bleomycin resistance/extradiol dioxygenase family protein [archaeon]|nr:glyoxalase/bleomycin resistance/extradiol dioxygenase family protein [archaeon]
MSEAKPSLNLLILRSQNVDLLRDFYQTLLQVSFEQHTDHGPVHYGMQVGSVYLEIYPTKKELAQLDSPGFSVKNLDEIIARVEAKYLHKAPVDSSFGRFAIIKDPDNRLVHLVEEIKKLNTN